MVLTCVFQSRLQDTNQSDYLKIKNKLICNLKVNLARNFKLVTRVHDIKNINELTTVRALMPRRKDRFTWWACQKTA